MSHVPSGSPREVLRRDRHAPVHRRRRRERGRRARGALFGISARGSSRRRRSRPSWRRSGRTSCATRVRAAEPAHDGLRAVRGERLRGHRPDQPRLPARRDRAAGFTAGTACARTSRSARSARTPRACCSRSHASTSRVPRFLVEGLKRRLGGSLRGPQGRGSRAWRSSRHRRRARLALAQADPPARTRARRRRGPRSACRDADASPADAVADADAVVLATNHSAFATPDARADRRPRGPDGDRRGPWDSFGTAQVSPPSPRSPARAPPRRRTPA